MNVRTLDTIPFEAIINCFTAAFKDYFVEMPSDPAYYRERWKAAKVRYEMSYGMFDGARLAGFIMNGIDRRHGHLTAFNAGTGVLPEYRGKKIVKSIYEQALPHLKKNGITQCALEVIQDNAIAIKAYQSIGFTISRRYKCFSGEINTETHEPFEVKEVSHRELDWERLPRREFYPWEHHKNSVTAGNYRYFYVMQNQNPQAYCILKPENGYVAQFDVLNEKKTSWSVLFTGIKQLSPVVKMNNIDERLGDKLRYIREAGLVNTIDQYEMELPLYPRQKA